LLNIIRFNNLPHSKGNVCKTYFVPTETTRKQEEMAKKQEELERNMQKQHEETMAEQSNTDDGIAAILEMVKQQQH